jgi:hypothetical protein
VCIYGGTDLQGTPTAFISALAYKILNSMPAVIVTGGFRRGNKNPRAISIDMAALEGARRYAKESGISLKKCYEAWIPEPSLDDRPDIDGVVRMSQKDGITLRVMTGRTPLGRRLAMVADVDIVVTIAGRKHTEVVVEQAVELGLPLLPIPDAGGESRELLKQYRKRIADRFAPGAFNRCLRDLSKALTRSPERAASTVVDLIRTAKVGRCLVLLPYNREHNRLYTPLIEPTVARHMFPLRLDRLPKSEAIYRSFADAVRSSSAVIADITHFNKNVMYEVGYAHGCGLTPLLYTRDAARLQQRPVYFRTLNVRLVSKATPVNVLIDDYLRSLKANRAVQQ